MPSRAMAPQVRNNGIVIAQAGTVAMAAGEQISLQFSDSRTLAGVLVSRSAIAALVENGSAVQAPGGMIIMSAQAANELQGGVVRNTGSVAAKIDAGTGNVSLLKADGSDKTNHMAGSISVNSITGATIKLINQGNGAGTVGDLPNLAANCCGFDLGYRGIGADVTLNAGAVLSASGAGTAVTLAAKGNFNNNSGNGAGSIASNAATLASGNYVLSGLVGSESFSITKTSGLFNASDISAGAATFASNYILPVSATGTGSITAKALTATLTGVSKAYDGDTAAVLNGANYQLVGMLGGQSASFSQTAGLYNSADVLGANSVSASLSGANFAAGGGTSLANYILPTMATGSASITPKTLSASLTGTIGKTYDGGSAALLGAANFSLSGFVGAQSASVTQTAGVYNSVNVATATSVTASLSAGDFNAGSGTTLSNYSLPVSASGGASIAAKSLSASLTGGNVALNGVVAGETIHVGTLNGSYDSRNAGTRTVSATLAGGDFTAGSSTLLGNYVLPTSAAGTAVITPKAITLNAPAISKVYDGTLAYTASAGDLSSLSAALVQGDTVTGASFSYADKNAGNSNSSITPRVLNATRAERQRQRRRPRVRHLDQRRRHLAGRPYRR